MSRAEQHTFHIPVMGLCYTIDTPLKIARFGISSVVSIIEDELVEEMRKYHCLQSGEQYDAITTDVFDFRAKRITAYLDLLNRLVKQQVNLLRTLPFEEGNDLTKYFELLPDNSPVKKTYREMQHSEEGKKKESLQQELRSKIIAGSIDVNIMSKIDKPAYTKSGEPLPLEYSDALSAFRGFANSELDSSVVFSAGYNPRLYAYIENFRDFFPDANGNLKKKIILKVSDYRSALTQGKLMAKKGLWVSEFRIESGLNCGGHAFATDGILLGPILEEFKVKKQEIAAELFEMCSRALTEKKYDAFPQQPGMKITVQGGIGTSNENNFLLGYYDVDGTGWGSPFLLVPEVTNVDDETLHQLATAEKEDYYLSNNSPLGIPFHNFRKSSAQKQMQLRIDKGRPGSPCYKKFLSTNTEFTALPICTASREYQQLKIKQLEEKNLPEQIFEAELKTIVEKDCLCEGLDASILLKNHMPLHHHLKAVTICPGPNLAYFSGIFTLQQMADHIYGRCNLLNSLRRPNMFVNELNLYTDYLKNEISKSIGEINARQAKYLQTFKTNLLEGVDYYKRLLTSIHQESERYLAVMKEDLSNAESWLQNLALPEVVPVK
ncbi:MAG: hypothetical protein NT126_01770 [Bacteroidetes bacterium]|nr:hypothetical protein [Bacteroidota bacterium]